MSFVFELIVNVLNNYLLVKNDFVGISINYRGLLFYLASIFLLLLIFFVLYCVGEAIRKKFFRLGHPRELRPFISIALGYIAVGNGIAIMGIFSLFYTKYLLAYLLLLTLFSLYSLRFLKEGKDDIFFVISKYKQNIGKHPWLHAAIFGFLLIGFLRLILPETGVDALWYHTDYPRLYLRMHTMMGFDPKGSFHFYPIVTPTLGDMYYVITQFFGIKDASRMIHYAFYVLVVMLFLVGFNKKIYPSNFYACLLLVTSPVIIRHTSTAYNEFQWVLCWLLVILIITRKQNISSKEIVLSAVLFGGTLATKLWMLPFYGVFILYLYLTRRKLGVLKVFKIILLFTFFSFLVPLLWYMRAYIVTGNPLFPAFRTEAGETDILSVIFIPFNALNLDSFKNRILSLASISPFSFFGLIFLFVSSQKIKIKNNRFILFAVILSITHFLINYNWHRFIIPFYSIITIVLGVGLARMLSRYPIFRPVFFISYIIMFSYYFLNTLFILPYGFGWADKNKYLTRILSRDNSSYYDYDYKFSKRISKKDIVATYGLWGFYYANFEYFYTDDIFGKKSKSFDILKEKGATKLLIKGGDINWLCKIERLEGCNSKKYAFLTSYIFPHAPASQYLYALLKMETYEK